MRRDKRSRSCLEQTIPGKALEFRQKCESEDKYLVSVELELLRKEKRSKHGNWESHLTQAASCHTEGQILPCGCIAHLQRGEPQRVQRTSNLRDCIQSRLRKSQFPSSSKTCKIRYQARHIDNFQARLKNLIIHSRCSTSRLVRAIKEGLKKHK